MNVLLYVAPVMTMLPTGVSTPETPLIVGAATMPSSTAAPGPSAPVVSTATSRNGEKPVWSPVFV